MIHLCLPTRSRSGSTFVNKLALLVDSPLVKGKPAGITGSRLNNREVGGERGEFNTAYKSGNSIDYIRKKEINIIKLEDPGKDSLVREIAESFPSCVFVASHRSLEKTVNSHLNIKKWGHSIEDVIYQYSACISIYEDLAKAGRLFLVNVDDPASFSPDSFCRFLKGRSCLEFEQFVQEWRPVNDLSYQKDKFGEEFHGVIEEHHQSKSLGSIHFWVAQAEAKYLKLVADSKMY